MKTASVFVVEDEALVRMALVDMIESLGHRVAFEAGHLDEALRLAESSPFDFAALDINIAGRFIDPVAAVIERRKLPFFFVTAYASAQLPASFRSRPVLQKPVTLTALQHTISVTLTAAAS